jgi:uncharacterized protein (DUF1778 family)
VSERKSAEIKFRCTPSFKSGLQAAADAAGQSLTEYIEAAVWAHQNAARTAPQIDMTVLRMLEDESEQALALKGSVPAPFTGTPTPVDDLLDEDDLAVIAEERDSAAALTCRCRPWEFCTHKARA